MRTSIARGCGPAAAALVTLLACRDAVTAPDSRTTAELNLLHVTYDYPQLAATTASFWAVKGQSSGTDLWYHARPGASDSAKFVEFRLGAGALDRRPDGSAIAVGDSVLITLKVTDARHMMIQYEPSGLRFAVAEQPTLRIFWTACGDDLNYDGKVDAADDAIAGQLGIWRQEGTDQPWMRLTSVVVKSAKEVRSQLEGFSGYALSY
jgi:hypothetical protein